jgi:DNA-binding HxlR family transcriptional regulator
MKGQKVNLALDECPIARSLDLIGDWWTLLIIRDAFQGKTRFGEFQKNLGLAKNILATRLRRLTEEGIFRQEADEDGSAYKRYVLTEKGHRLAPILIALWQWGEDFCFDQSAPSYRCVELKTQRPLALLEVRYEDGEKVDIRDFGFIGVRGDAPGGGGSGVGDTKGKADGEGGIRS